jgi:NitT/TauT family transport system permease protein
MPIRKLLLQTTIGHRVLSTAVVSATAIMLVLIALHFAHPRNTFDINRISLRDVARAASNTFYRMLLAYLLSLVVAVPLALLIAVTPAVQRILLPIADILQSVPVLAFFPVLVVFFTAGRQFELAAIFVIFMAMMWNITLPAIFPFIVTGSLLAWAQGWTVVIVAEVLHTYIPNANASVDLLGLGSLLVDSNAQQKTSVFVGALTAMILVVALINICVWQPLLRLAQRFRFD